jgi:hypothetical protein
VKEGWEVIDLRANKDCQDEKIYFKINIKVKTWFKKTLSSIFFNNYKKIFSHTETYFPNNSGKRKTG